MYTDITLYYLNQMGIRPWIRKTLSDSIAKNTIKLLMFKSVNLDAKSQSLLQQITNYLNLPDSELSVISIQEGDSPNNYHGKIKQQAPLAILVVGLNDINLSGRITSINPAYLIKNPKDKRKVFQELQSIKQLIS